MSSAFDPTFITGPLVVGWLMHWGLFGVLTVQLYIYYMSFPRDSPYIKAVVYGVYLMEVLLIVLNTDYAVHVLGSGWGNPDVLIRPVWTFTCTSGITGIVSATTQMFFSWRIWILSRSPYLPVLYSLVGIVTFIFAAITGIKAQILGDYREIEKVRTDVVVWLLGAAVCDVAITSTLLFYLLRHRSGVFQHTKDIINRLVRLTIETGLITAVAAVIEAILFVTQASNNLHYAVFLVLAKLYSNTLMATLNARSPLFSGERHVSEPKAIVPGSQIVSNVGARSRAACYHSGVTGPSLSWAPAHPGSTTFIDGVHISREYDVHSDGLRHQSIETLSLRKEDEESSVEGMNHKTQQPSL